MIRSVLSLQAKPGQAGAIEDFYAEHDVLRVAKQFSGCRDAQLLRAIDGSSITHLVIADWDGPEDYQRWLDNPWREALSPQLTTLLDTDPSEQIVGGLFEQVTDQ